MNRSGILDRRVVLQRRVVTNSSSGDTIETWSTVGTRWAGLSSLTGAEINVSQQWVAREQVMFTLRWDQSIADLSPLDRVVMPAGDEALSPEKTRSIYDIMAVHVPKRNDVMTITAARRADTP